MSLAEDWLMEEIFKNFFGRPKQPNQQGENKMASRKDRLRKQLEIVMEELGKLESRPDEPPKGSVIQFDMQFGGHGTVYEYAAIRAGDLWYTTGPRSPKGYTWDVLLDWMEGNTEGFQLMRPKIKDGFKEISS